MSIREVNFNTQYNTNAIKPNIKFGAGFFKAGSIADTFDSFVPSFNKTRLSKNELNKLFQKLYKDSAKTLSKTYGGIKVIPPEIKLSDESDVIGYCIKDNTIHFPKAMLNTDILIDGEQGNIWTEDDDGFEYAYSFLTPINKKDTEKAISNNPNLKRATKEQKTAIILATLRHELEHCAQVQAGLSIDGVTDEFILRTAKSVDLDESIVRTHYFKDIMVECYPFLFSYSPKKKLDEKSRFPNFSELKITFDDFKKAALVATDASANEKTYYSNVNEILARKAECNFWKNDIKKYCPKLSQEFIHIQSLSTEHNMLQGLLAYHESKNS